MVKNKSNTKQETLANYIEVMQEALSHNDYDAFEVARAMLDEAVSDIRNDEDLRKQMDTTNFGVLNHIFESELPLLLKTNKKAVKEVIKTIKEDSNLLAEFNFYNTIKEGYKGGMADKADAEYFLEKLVKIVSEDIDLKSVKASNKKLKKVMVENNICPSIFIDDESMGLYESGNIILTRKKTTANMVPLIESYDSVCKYMERHKNDEVRGKFDINEAISEYEDKLKATLNESEISFVKEITTFKGPIAEKRKMNLFNALKAECVKKIDEMLMENQNDDALRDLKGQIDGIEFSNESLVKDVAKLLEIRDILFDD